MKILMAWILIIIFIGMICFLFGIIIGMYFTKKRILMILNKYKPLLKESKKTCGFYSELIFKDEKEYAQYLKYFKEITMDIYIEIINS
jgi:hypothetical protein